MGAADDIEKGVNAYNNAIQNPHDKENVKHATNNVRVKFKIKPPGLRNFTQFEFTFSKI